MSKKELISIIKEKDEKLSRFMANLKIENSLNKIIESAPIGICLTDKNGCFEFVNASYCDIYGYDKEELLGKKFTIVVPEKEKEKFQKMHDNFIEYGTEIRGEWRVKGKDGNELIILADAARLEDKEGDFKKLTYVVDITEKNELEEKLRKKKNNLSKTIDHARQIHKRFLPASLPELKNYDLDVYYQPSERVGGDLYNAFVTEGKLVFYLSDVTGHYLGSTLLNIFARETINNYLSNNNLNEISPCNIIKELHNNYNRENFPDEYFIAIIIGIIDINTGEVKLSNAGIHIPPVVINKKGELHILSEACLPISSAIDDRYFKNIEEINLKLKKEDILVLSTDGLIEESSGNSIFGQNRYFNILKSNHKDSPSKVISTLKNEFISFAGKKQGIDDITVMAIKNY